MTDTLRVVCKERRDRNKTNTLSLVNTNEYYYLLDIVQYMALQKKLHLINFGLLLSGKKLQISVKLLHFNHNSL